MLKQGNSKGFTIVELLVVIVIIGILATITIVAYTGLTQKAISISLQSDLTQAYKQIKISQTQSDNESYPGSVSDCPAPSSGNICIKSSGSNTFSYNVNNSANPKSFILIAHNGSIIYSIDSTSSTPTAVTSTSFAIAWGGASNDYTGSIAQTQDDNYIVVGSTSSFGAGFSDAYIAKYDSLGNLLWDKTWGGTNNDYGRSVLVTSDGGYLINGETSSFGAGSSDVFVAKFDSSGNLSWSKTWGGAATDLSDSIIATSDGGFAISGITYSYGAGSGDVFLAKYDTSNNLSWSQTWGSAGSEFNGMSFTQVSDGGFIIAGGSGNFGAGSQDIFLAKYDSSGNFVWNKTWGGTNSDQVSHITSTSDGGIILAGDTSSFGAGSNDALLAKYDSSGNLSWSRTWGGTAQDQGGFVTVSGNEYILSGYTQSFGAGSNDVFVANYNSSGNFAWNSTWGSSSAEGSGLIITTKDGGFVITGSTYGYGAGNQDSLVLKYKNNNLMGGCSSPMCQTPTATLNSPTATVTTPSATRTSPNATTNSPTATITSPTATHTIIVPAQ